MLQFLLDVPHLCSMLHTFNYFILICFCCIFSKKGWETKTHLQSNTFPNTFIYPPHVIHAKCETICSQQCIFKIKPNSVIKIGLSYEQVKVITENRRASFQYLVNSLYSDHQRNSFIMLWMLKSDPSIYQLQYCKYLICTCQQAYRV